MDPSISMLILIEYELQFHAWLSYLIHTLWLGTEMHCTVRDHYVKKKVNVFFLNEHHSAFKKTYTWIQKLGIPASRAVQGLDENQQPKWYKDSTDQTQSQTQISTTSDDEALDGTNSWAMSPAAAVGLQPWIALPLE